MKRELNGLLKTAACALAAAALVPGAGAAPKDAPPRKVLVGTLCRRFAGTPEARADRAERLIDELGARARETYGGRRLDLVVLPEHALMREAKEAAGKTVPLAFVRARLGAAARRNGCYVAAGAFVCERVDGRDCPRNALVLLDRKGEVAGVYNKVHTACTWGDPATTVSEDGIAPGAGFPVFETDFGKVGFLVCFDMSYADGWAALKRGGAEIVAVSSMSPQVFRPSLFAHLHQYWVVTATPRSQAAVITPLGFVKEKVGGEASLLSEIDLSFVMLHWSPELKGGRALADRFGADAFGGLYDPGEDNGIFWSNRPDLPIGRMIEAINVRPRDDEAARAARVADGNRVAGRGDYR